MQITENTDYALRVAVLELRRDEAAPVFTLYPMIHIGERPFYETVRDEIRKHDLLICEGTSGRAIRWLTQIYRQPVRNREFGWVLQSSVLRVRELGIPYRVADLPGEEVDRLWAKVPFCRRWTMQLGALALGLLWRDYGSVFALRKLTSTEDRRAIDTDDSWAQDDALHDARDAVLVAKLEEAISEGPKYIAVLYGANHMRAAIRCLTDAQGYRITKARWLNVVTY